MNGVSALGKPVRIGTIILLTILLTHSAITPAATPVSKGSRAAGNASEEPDPKTSTRPATRPTLKLPALGDHLEVKWGGLWLPATVKNKSPKGWILIQYDRDKFFEWVEPWRVRKPGTDIDVPWASSNHALFKPEPPPTNPPSLTPPEEHRAVERRAEDAPATTRPNTAESNPQPSSVPAAFELPITKAVGVARPITLAPAAPAWSLAPDVPNPAPKPTNQSIELKGGSREFFESPQLIVPRGGGGSPIALVSYIDAPPGKPAAVRCERVNLATGASNGVLLMPAASEPLELSPSGKVLLSRAYSREPGKRDRLDLWSVVPTGAAPPKHQLSFKPYDGEDWPRRDAVWASFVDDQHLLTLSSEGLLIHWDLTGPAPKADWQIALSRFGSAAAFSPTRKYLAASDDKDVVFLDPQTGNLLGRLEGAGMAGGDIAFRDDGKQLVTLSSGRTIRTWDLETGKLLRDVLIPKGGSGAPIAFADNDYILLGGGRDLLDLDRRIILWQYELPYHDPPASGQWASRFWQYIAPESKTAAPTLVSAALPHDEAKKIAATLKPEDLLLIKPGITVSLEVNIEASDKERQQVIDSLKSKLRKNQITLADTPQPIKLIATTSLGESRQQEYEQFATGHKTSVTITPHITRLAFETSDGKIAWESATTTSAHSMLNAKEPGGLQSAADATAKYNIPFLISCPLPPYVTIPRDAASFGRSRLTARGVESTDARPSVRPHKR